MYRKKVYLWLWFYVNLHVWGKEKDNTLWLVKSKGCKRKHIAEIYLYGNEIAIATIAHESNHLARVLQDRMHMRGNSSDKENIKRTHKAIKRMYDVSLWPLPDNSDYYGEMRAWTTGEITNKIYRWVSEIMKRHKEIVIVYYK